MIFYYLRKKSKLRGLDQYRYTTVNCLFMSYINIVYNRYYCASVDESLTTQQHIDRDVTIAGYERSIKDIINEFLIPASLP